MSSSLQQPESKVASSVEGQPAREMIAILDYGSQYSRLIARRVRECRVYCELLPATTTMADLQRLGAKGVILSGGPDSVYDENARHVDQEYSAAVGCRCWASVMVCSCLRTNLAAR